MILQVNNLGREFTRGKEQFWAVRNVSFDLREGEMISVVGQSGSGKSTLFHMLTGMIRPSEGTIQMLGKDLGKLNSNDMAQLRSTDLGYIMQGQNLLPNLSVMENILLPTLLHKDTSATKEKAEELLELLGISPLKNELPNNLSGGEQRRVAIARSFVQNAKLIIADEPTSNLDPENAKNIMEYFRKMADKGVAILVSTHQLEFMDYADRCLHMQNGKIIE